MASTLNVSSEELQKSRPDFCGWLRMKNQYDLFDDKYIIGANGNLYCFENPKSVRACGAYGLSGYRAYEVENDDNGKELVLKHYKQGKQKTLEFEAYSMLERENWVQQINRIIQFRYPETFNLAVVDYPDDFMYSQAKDHQYQRVSSVRRIRGTFIGPRQHKMIPPAIPERSLKQVSELDENHYDNVDECKKQSSLTNHSNNNNYVGDNPYDYVTVNRGKNVYPQNPSVQNQLETTYEEMSAMESLYVKMTEENPYEQKGAENHYERMEAENHYEQMTAEDHYDVPKNNRRHSDPRIISSIVVPTTNGLHPPSRSLSVDSKKKSSISNDLLPPSVFRKGMEKHECSSVLKSAGVVGTYLIRTGRTDGMDALAVLADEQNGKALHYIIYKDDKYFLKKGEAEFSNLIELINFYRRNNLPTCTVKLTRPLPPRPLKTY